ncbi:hypothetical protein D3C72_2106010 [compost metagenome]
MPEIHAGEGDSPDDDGVRDGCGKPKQDRLRDRAADGDDECRHHRLGMARFKPVQRAKQNSARDKQPCVSGSLLDQVGEIGHRNLKGIW